MQLATVIYPLAFAVLGAFVYALTKDKLSELGKIIFSVGMLWLVYTLAHATMHL